MLQPHRQTGGEPVGLRKERRRLGVLKAAMRRQLSGSPDWRDLVAVAIQHELEGTLWPEPGVAADLISLVAAAEA